MDLAPSKQAAISHCAAHGAKPMSINVRKNLLLAAAFVSGVLAVGVPYWSMAYGKVKLPVALVGPGLLVRGMWRTTKSCARCMPSMPAPCSGTRCI